jgi:hypothetical protein
MENEKDPERKEGCYQPRDETALRKSADINQKS